MKKMIPLLSLMLLVVVAFAAKKHHAKPQRRNNIYLGAYYFNGWSKDIPGEITPRLKDGYPERKSKWGWETGTPEIVQAQIDAAADAGISFFSFDWYSPDSGPETFQTSHLNDALKFYLQAPNRNRLNFNIIVCNHAKFTIGPNNWSQLCQEWIRLFKDPQYVRANGKPLISFYTTATLVTNFGSAQAVKEAFKQFRQECKDEGLGGATIAGCVGPMPKSEQQAEDCGFDILSEYNYHSAGFPNMQPAVYPIDSLVTGEYRAWSKVVKFSGMSFMPAITLNWDPRPKGDKPPYSTSPRYEGYSAESVAKSIKSAERWMDLHPDRTTRERIAILYAWNEITEGGYLTPSENSTINPLDGVRQALSY